MTVFLISCLGGPTKKSPEQLIQELKLMEQINFNEYLTIEYTLDVTLFSGQDIIKGHIKNSASIAKFKDIVLTVTFFSETDTQLDSKDYVVYKFLEPNSQVDFEIRTKSPKATSKIGVKVKEVTLVD